MMQSIDAAIRIRGLTKRPEELIYTVDEVPPLRHLILLGAQYAALLAVYLMLVVVVVRAGGATRAQTVDAVSLGMIAAAAGTILQALKRGPIGSGFLAAPVFSAIYLGPSLIAANHYGLGVVFGMTIFAGLVEIAISRFLSRLRVFFPPAISGFIVTIVGIQLGLVGVDHVLDIANFGTPLYPTHLGVSMLTLAVIIGSSVWAGGMARLMCSSIGIVTGFALSVIFGLVSVEALSEALSGPVVRIPHFGHISYDFEWSLMPAFLIAGIAAALRTVGVITTCQKINDADWKRPDQQSIKNGMLADGLGCVVGGLLGCIGQNTGPSLVGVSKASGATSRSIAFSAGAILLVFAFLPTIGAVFMLLPKAVVGAALVFTACFMITGGIQIIVSRNVDTRMTYVIGLSMLLGLSRNIYKDFFKHLPQALQPLTNTTLALAVVTALVLHSLFRIGSRKTAYIAIDDNEHSVDMLADLLQSQGRSWSLPSDLSDRAVATTEQVLGHLHDTKLVQGNLSIALSYDELDLVATISYEGGLLTLPNVGVRKRVFLEEESFSYGLADFLIGVYPDHMEASARGDTVTIRLVFAT
jgi:NCS2 family nucleobase:cation symporter-2